MGYFKVVLKVCSIFLAKVFDSFQQMQHFTLKPVSSKGINTGMKPPVFSLDRATSTSNHSPSCGNPKTRHIVCKAVSPQSVCQALQWLLSRGKRGASFLNVCHLYSCLNKNNQSFTRKLNSIHSNFLKSLKKKKKRKSQSAAS